MAQIKLTDAEGGLAKALPALSDGQVEDIAKFLERASYYRFISEDGFCCPSDAIDLMPSMVADFLRNGYGLKNNLMIRDRDHEDYEEDSWDE